MIAHSHAGPLPPAREFGRYDEVLPGAGDRILSMAENEQAHRHEMERGMLKSESGFKGRGQLFAFLGLIVMLGAVIAMALMGQAVAGASLGGAVIVGVVALFLGQRYIARKEAESPDSAED
jgi:uncharacterized membrane protein